MCVYIYLISLKGTDAKADAETNAKADAETDAPSDDDVVDAEIIDDDEQTS